MVDVDVGDDQRTDVVNREIDGEIGGICTAPLFLALEQAAVNQNAGRANVEFVAGACDAGGGAVVLNIDHLNILVQILGGPLASERPDHRNQRHRNTTHQQTQR